MSEKTLEQVRGNWEVGSTPLVVMDQEKEHGRVLVVLEAEVESDDPWAKAKKRYNCHRYFCIMNDWCCSVDGELVELDAVWSWLNNPCAATTKPRGYVRPEPVPYVEEGIDTIE